MEHIVGGISRDVQYWKPREPLIQPLSQRPSIQLGHDHIGDDQVEVGMGKSGHLKRLLAMAGLESAISCVPEDFGQKPADEVVVFGHQHDSGFGELGLWRAQGSTHIRGRFCLTSRFVPRSSVLRPPQSP